MLAMLHQQAQSSALQQNMYGNMVGQTLISSPAAVTICDSVFDQMQNAAPRAKIIPTWDIERGGTLCARIAFWREIPLLGKIVAYRLASRLEDVCDRLEVYA